MQSSTDQTAFPDRTRDHNPPPPKVSSDDPELPHYDHKADDDQPWQPNPDRRQSWSTQDRKHLLQERLLGMQEGREMGFSESSHEH